jgi:secondary thiamine-phosphate synthase enzyme
MEFAVRHDTLEIETRGKGTVELTESVRRLVAASGIQEGTVCLFARHTSCSLVIMENADPSARADLHEFFERLVPEDTPWFQHDTEGPDDMPSHIRMALTRTSETIPIQAAARCRPRSGARRPASAEPGSPVPCNQRMVLFK